MQHKVVFYEDVEQVLSKHVDKAEDKSRPRDVPLAEYYEITRTVQWIEGNDFDKVCCF
jgi:hypothetical protein